MALLSMATFCTADNDRAPLLKRTLDSLLETVDFSRHRIILIVNSSTEESAASIGKFLKAAGPNADVIWLPENVGTARAINKAWRTRQDGEHAIKMDDDVVIHRAGWVDEMEESISRQPKIGIIGLKRKDLLESVHSTDPAFRSTLDEIPHKPGEKNIFVERVAHVMGTCQMYNSALLEKIGYLYQPGIYGFDDSLAGVRCMVAGFVSCFLCGVEIDHIDPGGNYFTQWKRDVAGRDMAEYHRIKAGYLNGSIPIWYGPTGEQEGDPVQTDNPARYGWTVPNLNTR